jgi:hypothetical protein
MALVRDPVGRAQAAKTKVQAARLHLELESELGLNDQLPDGWETQAEQAIEILQRRAESQDWGDLTHPDATTGYTRARGGDRIPHTWSPSLSHRAARNEANPDHPPADAPAEHRQRAQTVRRRIKAASSSSWTPSVPSMPGGLVGQALSVVLGASLVYLLLTDAENPGRGWPSAVQTAVNAVTTGIMAIVRPVDPLRPHMAAPAMPRPAAVAPSAVASPTSVATPLPLSLTRPPVAPGPGGSGKRPT